MFIEYLGVLIAGLIIGIGAGIGLALYLKKPALRLKTTAALPDLRITGVTCDPVARQVVIEFTLAPPPADFELVAIYAMIYDDPATVWPPSPITAGATKMAGLMSPATLPIPAGMTGRDLAVLWAEYRTWNSTSMLFRTCSGGGSDGIIVKAGMAPMLAAAAVALEVIPGALRVTLSGSEPATTGPVGELVGALTKSPEAVLRHVPEASTPAEPCWRALGGPGAFREATLRLLHRTGGCGAVLTVVLQVAERQLRLTWVTSDWRAHTVNRLACESDEPGLPPLLVSPA